jgi:hypothetical protein
MALTLLGSDSEHLADGTAALQEVIAEHGSSTAGAYAKLAVGVNAARPFLDVGADGTVRSHRGPNLKQADEVLRPELGEARDSGGLDELTVYQAAGYLAYAHQSAGDAAGARAVRRGAVQRARSKDMPPSVLSSLTATDDAR